MKCSGFVYVSARKKQVCLPADDRAKPVEEFNTQRPQMCFNNLTKTEALFPDEVAKYVNTTHYFK